MRYQLIDRISGPFTTDTFSTGTEAEAREELKGWMQGTDRIEKNEYGSLFIVADDGEDTDFYAEPITTRCGECNGKGVLTVLGGDWGKAHSSEAECWACKGSGRVGAL